jgi:hypothetical protein
MCKKKLFSYSHEIRFTARQNIYGRVSFAPMRITHARLSNIGGFIMKSRAIVFILLALLALPALALAGAVSEEDFQVKTTQNLINLCTVSPGDPLYHHAINFAHGYLVGAFQFYVASSSGPKGVKLLSIPDPAPSRNEVIKMFVDWAKDHPQYMNEKPVETEFRFLMEKWPYKP